MPPRGRPSGRAARGRGSQRGARGGARGGASESQPDTPSQAEETDSAVDDGSSIAAAPGSRPAATTAAPAPSPSALRGRGLSSSYAKPSPFLAAGARAAAAPRTTSSFKPKANKRSEAERIEMEQQELRKLNERAAEEAELRRAMFSGGRRGRGRGYASGVGRGGLVKRVVTPSGPFSQPPGVFGSSSTTSRGGGLGSGGSGGGSYRGRGSRSKTDAWFGTTQSSEDSPERFRINTDLFSSQMTLDDDSSMPRAHLLPMGILREEHKDAEVLVATSKAGGEAKEDPDAASEHESDSDDLWVEDSEHSGIVDDNRVWPGAPKASRIKIEGEEMTTIDGLAAKRQGKAIPREQQAATTTTTTTQTAATGEAGEAGPSAAGGGGTRQPGNRRAKTKKPKKPKVQEAEKPKNPEVEDEELRRQILLNEFGLLNLDGAAANPQDKEGRLYMLNFPPVLAPLQAVQPDAGVKQEPEEDDVVMTDAVSKARIDLTNDANDAEIKEEDGTGAKAPGGAQRPGHQMDVGGFLGMLHVRKSGRAELDWGGLKLEMMAKTLPNMLQSVVLLEQSDTKRKAGDTTSAGKAYGMGPIMAKFGFNIDLGEEKEWIVDPADLEE